MRLLLAVDLDDEAEALVDEGITWSHRLGAILDLAWVDEHTYSALLIRDPAVRVIYDREWATVRHRQEERLRTLLARVPELHRGRSDVHTGRAPEELVSAAKGHDAILLRTHGRRGLSHVMLGSVAERVVRTSTVPVIVLPHPPDASA